MNKLTKQIFKFLIVGGIAFLIDYALLYILTEYCNIYYLVSSVISFTISLIFNYIASIKFVFETDKKDSQKHFIIFIIGSIIGLGINQLVMYVMVELMNVYYMLVKIVATGIVMVWNFITRKIFIEKKND
ncbi:MAG: GtrA family protein [Bacilli bacterium]|nr:GtrA family protein [Bacilli bacterium]